MKMRIMAKKGKTTYCGRDVLMSRTPQTRRNQPQARVYCTAAGVLLDLNIFCVLIPSMSESNWLAFVVKCGGVLVGSNLLKLSTTYDIPSDFV